MNKNRNQSDFEPIHCNFFGLASSARRWFLILSFLIAMPFAGLTQERVDLTPTEFKLAFLAKIPAYITWPNSEGQVVVGIMGKDPFDGLLSQLLKQKKIEGREIVVKIFEDPALVTRCDVLFIPADQLVAWEELSKSIDKRGILTIGEKREFLNKGGVFSLSVDDRKLEINLQNARKAGLEINSKLVKIAKVIVK